MSNFGDLIKKTKDVDKSETEKTPANPFAALGKAVADAKSVTAAGEEVSVSPRQLRTSSPAQFAFLGKKQEKPEAVAVDVDAAANASLAASGKTPPDDPMEGISGGSFSTANSAKEYQAEDQPDKYDQEFVNALKDSLDILTNSMGNKELVGDALKKIMVDLKRKPFLIDILHPEDCNLMVMSLRESYGITLAKKQTRSTKRASTQKEVEEAIDMLADVEITL